MGMPRRPDQAYNPPAPSLPAQSQSGVFRGFRIIVSSGQANSGIFVYNGTPGLGNPPVFSVVAPGVTSDPFGNLTGPVVQIGTFTGAHVGFDSSGNFFLVDSAAKVVSEFRTSDGALFFYNTSGQGLSNLTFSIAPAATTDPAGNAVNSGAVSYVLTPAAGVTNVRMHGNVLNFPASIPANIAPVSPTVSGSGDGTQGPCSLTLDSGQSASAGTSSQLNLSDSTFAAGPVAEFNRPLLLDAQSAAPPTPNVNGGGDLYVDSTGHLTYKGPAGTVTVLANP